MYDRCVPVVGIPADEWDTGHMHVCRVAKLLKGRLKEYVGVLRGFTGARLKSPFGKDYSAVGTSVLDNVVEGVNYIFGYPLIPELAFYEPAALVAKLPKRYENVNLVTSARASNDLVDLGGATEVPKNSSSCVLVLLPALILGGHTADSALGLS